jgi:hypothetical protein
MNKSYVIWNNKGGVGKSTIVFHISSMYAEQNPDQNVVVIDMCPQANSSMMLMDGGTNAKARLQELIIGDIPRTVVGYLTDSVLKNDTSDINKYLLQLQESNSKLPPNLFLMSGDGNLELIAPLLAERADATPLSTTDSPWTEIHSIIKKFTELGVFRKLVLIKLKPLIFRSHNRDLDKNLSVPRNLPYLIRQQHFLLILTLAFPSIRRLPFCQDRSY